MNKEKAKLLVVRRHWTQMGEEREQDRIIKLLMDLNVIRRCAATDKLVAFDTNGEKVVYLTGLEKDDNPHARAENYDFNTTKATVSTESARSCGK